MILYTSCHHYTLQGPTSAQPNTDASEHVMRYAEYLRSLYKIKPCGDQWSPVASKRYINLSVVESIEDFPKEKEHICRLAMMQSKIEDVKKFKKSIQITRVGEQLCNHGNITMTSSRLVY